MRQSGMETGFILDDQITASSNEFYSYPGRGRLNETYGTVVAGCKDMQCNYHDNCLPVIKKSYVWLVICYLLNIHKKINYRGGKHVLNLQVLLYRGIFILKI